MVRRKRSKVIEMEIIETHFPNKSIGTHNDKIIKIKGGIKGQKVKVLLGRKRRDHIQGKLLEVLEKSPLEKNITSQPLDKSGACSYAGLLYEDEIDLKEKQVLDLFKRKGIENINFLGIERSPNVEGYRNKMEYTFGDEVKDGPLILGLHERGKFYSIVDSDGCNMVDSDFTNIRKSVMNYFRDLEMPHYHRISHVGFLRHLVIRKALSTGEILINLVTSSQEELDKEDFVNILLDCEKNHLIEGSKIIGILHTINDGLGDVVQADNLELLYGRDYIVEEILDLKFEISPFSFFQTNTYGAEKLYRLVREFAGDIQDKTIFDLYSGTGTIAQIMAPLARKVIGIEIVEEAVEKARDNSKLNELDNVEFIAGDVLKEVDKLEDKADIIVIDPPR